MKPTPSNGLAGADLTALPTGFTVSYDGNTWPLKSGDIMDSIEDVMEINGIPSDTHMVVTAPNGDSLKLGPDQGVDADAQILTAENWATNELKKFVTDPARKVTRKSRAKAARA